MNSSLAHSKITYASVLITFGIIFGDIGTSPLYVMKAIIRSREITETIVYGGVSCIFWTLFFQTTIKYVWLTLQADNNGEGGIISLYSLINKKGKRLVIPTIIGAAMLLADGIITPPVSVTSAVEGLRFIEGFEEIPIIPIVIFILSILFLVQRSGTSKVGKIFGPMMFIWFTFLMLTGAYLISKHPEIFKSLNPYYAYNLLVNYPEGFWILGAVFLCTTGAEALYSDLGHCGKKNIRISWIYVKLALIINYLGQAAWLMHADISFLNGQNPFFAMLPSFMLLPGIIISTCAAIIASQALITGSFTLVNEAINIGFWPRTMVVQPNEEKSQIYIPTINFLLWAGCVFIVLYFQSSEHMEAAYGLAITVTMLMTTYLLAFYLFLYKKLPKILIGIIILIFTVIEISFFSANLLKFTEGGYIALTISLIFIVLMYCNYYGKILNERNLEFVSIKEYKSILSELSEDKTINKYSTLLFYFTKSNRKNMIEKNIINSILAKRPKRADMYWFINIIRTNQPYTLNYELIEIEKQKIYKVIFHIGFRIQPKTELYIKRIINDLYQGGEMQLKYLQPNLKKYNQDPDIKFILLKKFPSIENSFSIRELFILKIYALIKRIEYNIIKSFGLERNDVIIEQVPLYLHSKNKIDLKRIK
ncbi:KUP/HAK/KT family potassium transporter [Faecalibacter rhinopitheci]|uniref:Probable potassium transport system protein Kup n=1 Tax=Faecalibacter rhinopitheci TaxID=2779678 RepID=A0A8J7K4W7_9FLAO|nr:KUP/HAK/KT family potassium transporter [Faecalibacter rhinopitheci]MBF0598174.1 KUP/HAK/KT family potassium transporter [Faecalibacter rhinopitheci]